MKENDFMCCSGSCTEAFSKLNSGIYCHNDSAIYVNLYVPSKVYWKKKKVQLEQTCNFPKESVVDFQLSVKHPTNFFLKYFIPCWAKEVDIFVNGKKINTQTKSSSFFEVERCWADQDKVRIEFHYNFYLRMMPDKENMFAVFYGPMMLAFETKSEVILRSDKNVILRGLSKVDGITVRFVLQDGTQTYDLRLLFDIDDQQYGVYATIRDF